MRLIDADALLTAYDAQHKGEPGAARRLIEDAPTVGGWISVEDRKPAMTRGDHNENDIGKWIFHSHNPSYSPFDGSPSEFYRCSSCGYIAENRTEYCPKCGKKMDK